MSVQATKPKRRKATLRLSCEGRSVTGAGYLIRVNWYPRPLFVHRPGFESKSSDWCVSDALSGCSMMAYNFQPTIAKALEIAKFLVEEHCGPRAVAQLAASFEQINSDLIADLEAKP